MIQNSRLTRATLAPPQQRLYDYINFPGAGSLFPQLHAAHSFPKP